MAIREAKTREPRTSKFHIYVVSINGENRLVRTTSRSRAIKAVTTPVEARIATQDELVDLLSQDVKVEEPAGE